MKQEHGIFGSLVAAMIKRNVRARFHSVQWIPKSLIPNNPVVFLCNHHGWHDGYILYHLVKAVGKHSVDWIQEFDSFPLFRYVGGLPFPKDNVATRISTIKRTISLMKHKNTSLILFGEGVLHNPPEILPIGKSVNTILKMVPQATVIPVGLLYQYSQHERPTAYITLGDEIPAPKAQSLDFRILLSEQLQNTIHLVTSHPHDFQVLVNGTLDVNERLRFPKWHR